MLRETSVPLNWLALVPFAVAGLTWWREATWFQSWNAIEGIQLALFVIACAMVVWLLSIVVLVRAQSGVRLVVSGLLLAAACGLFARQAVVAVLGHGYSTELQAYTSLVALVAGKRGLLFVLCAALCPILLAVIIALRRGRTAQAASAKGGA